MIYDVLSGFPQGTVIIEGDCRGADRKSGRAALELGFTLEVYPADWKKYGRAAGPIRNKQMIDEGKPNLVIAFHNSIESSKGTKNMVEQAKKANIPFKVISDDGKTWTYKWIYDPEHKELIDISIDNPKLKKLFEESVRVR